MFDKVVEKLEKTYVRCHYLSFGLLAFVVIYFLLSYLTKIFSNAYMTFNPNVAAQFDKGFSSIINIIDFVILLVLCIITIVATRKRSRKGLVIGSIIGFIFFAFSAIALAVIGKKPEYEASALIFWIVLIIFGLINMVLFGLLGFVRIDILKSMAKPKGAKLKTKTTKTKTVTENKEVYEDYDVQESYSETSSTDSTSDYTESRETNYYNF